MKLSPKQQQLLLIIYQLETNGVIVRNPVLQEELETTARVVCYRADCLIEKGLLLRATRCFYTLTEKGIAEAMELIRLFPDQHDV